MILIMVGEAQTDHMCNPSFRSFIHFGAIFLGQIHWNGLSILQYQKCVGHEKAEEVCRRERIVNGLEGEYIFFRAKHHERAIIPVSWQMRRMVHLYGTSFSNLPSDNKPNRISYFLSASKFLWQFNYLCWISVDGSFILEKLEVWVMKQKLHAKNNHAHQYAHLS